MLARTMAFRSTQDTGPLSEWTAVGAGGANIQVVSGELKITTGSAATDYIQRAFGSDYNEVWAQFTIRIPAFGSEVFSDEGFLHIVNVNNGNMALQLEFRIASTTDARLRLRGQRDPGSVQSSTVGSLTAFTPANTTTLVDLHFARSSGANDGILRIYIGGSGTPWREQLTVENDTIFANAIRLGAISTLQSHTALDILIDSLKVGTTRGGSQIFAEDF